MSSVAGRSPPGKKENKQKKGKREGTPEKGPEDSKEEVEVEKKPAIFDETIAKLQITEESLAQLTEDAKAEDAVDSALHGTMRVAVRKEIPENLRKPPMKSVSLLKRAPPNAAVVPLEDVGQNGPRVTQDGNVVPHSILGSLEDYYRMALRRGDLRMEDVPGSLVSAADDKGKLPVSARHGKRSVRSAPGFPRKVSDENAALKNWEAKMHERKRQQGYISNLLQRAPDQLIMNSGEGYRKIQEDRYLIDRTIPFMDYGKGFRVGSEYWKQQEIVGPDVERGLHMTLTQTEKGYPPAIEHIGLPGRMKIEKGVDWERTKTPRYPWKFPYYVERKQQLSEVMAELDPHRTCFSSLEIIGERVRPATASASGASVAAAATAVHQGEGGAEWLPVHEAGDSRAEVNGLERQDFSPALAADRSPQLPAQILGPSLLFGGQPARWTGDPYAFEDAVGIEARVIFQAQTDEKCEEHLEIINDGTTVLHYDWKKLPKSNPFDLVQSNVRRFYFNSSSGVLLPGERLNFPFLFKSENAGLFTEQWQFLTRPVLCGGAALIVTLRGIALQEDIHAEGRGQLEAQLRSQAAERMALSILLELIAGIQEPERPKTPLGAYRTEEDEFRKCNPTFEFTQEAITRLRTIHNETLPEELKGEETWDLSINSLREAMLSVEAESNSAFNKKEEAIKKFQAFLPKISFKIPSPNQTEHSLLYQTGYRLWIETINTAFDEWQRTRRVHGLPEMEIDIPDPSDKRKGGRDAKSRAGGAKDAKSGAASRAGKEIAKPAAPPRKRVPSGGFRSPPASSERGASPSAEESAEVIAERRCHATIYGETYAIMGAAVERMTDLFSDIQALNLTR